MAILSPYIFEKVKNAFSHRTQIEINAIKWLTVQNEGKQFIRGRIHQNDEELIESMKRVDAIYQKHYSELKEYRYDDKILQSELEDIVIEENKNLKLFEEITYEIRDDENPSLYLYDVEGYLADEYFLGSSGFPDPAHEISKVINNNRDNPYNLHIVVYIGVIIPEKNIWIPFDKENDIWVEVSFEVSEEEKPKLNIVKEYCQELEITQKELADKLKVSEPTIAKWNKGEIPKMAQLALDLMLENRAYKNKLQKIKEAQSIISSI